MLTRRVSHMGKGRHAIWTHISFLLNYKKTDRQQEILHGTPPELQDARAHLDMCIVHPGRQHM
jgi:hypothetical protein